MVFQLCGATKLAEFDKVEVGKCVDDAVAREADILEKTRMSALGQKEIWAHVRVMSGSPPKADIGTSIGTQDRFSKLPRF